MPSSSRSIVSQSVISNDKDFITAITTNSDSIYYKLHLIRGFSGTTRAIFSNLTYSDGNATIKIIKKLKISDEHRPNEDAVESVFI